MPREEERLCRHLELHSSAKKVRDTKVSITNINQNRAHCLAKKKILYWKIYSNLKLRYTNQFHQTTIFLRKRYWEGILHGRGISGILFYHNIDIHHHALFQIYKKYLRPTNGDPYRNGSNKVLDVSTDHCFCKSFTNVTILILMNNKPVLDDIFLLKIKSLLITKFELTWAAFA